MLKKTVSLIPLMLIGACAYVQDGAIQPVEFKTPGATNAVCNVYIEKVKYVVRPTQTVNLFKSYDTMKVDCLAPGNRRKVVYIEPDIERSSYGNIATAGVGYAWDAASQSLWSWPDIIEVNFTDTPVKGFDLPAQNAPDIRQPEDYEIEQYSPSTPSLNRDKNAPPIEILRREGATVQSSSSNNFALSEPPAGTYGGKGDVQPVSPSVGTLDLNPAGEVSESSSSIPPVSGPMPLLPPSSGNN
jgi:hypothetical protein